jgi:hypothetical protein
LKVGPDLCKVFLREALQLFGGYWICVGSFCGRVAHFGRVLDLCKVSWCFYRRLCWYWLCVGSLGVLIAVECQTWGRWHGCRKAGVAEWCCHRNLAHYQYFLGYEWAAMAHHGPTAKDNKATSFRS